MANYNGSLEAVDCDIHSVRNDMVLETSPRLAAIPNRTSSGHLPCCSMADALYTIMANYNTSLQGVDCDIHSVRYDMSA
eukprot:scaffold13164_cov105-Skeletonema_dohrnii-CCMP3373.AAC.1